MTIHTDAAGHTLGARIHPETHQVLHRDVRQQVFKADDGVVVVADLPGWYPEADGEPILTADDEKIRVRAVAALNALQRGFSPASP
ncbi:hypothetical protein [Acidisphaera sp. L21]|uniref:hypothetical protein n=1 Tax=Acidisphaera sp. L21 TaxID=1641851 RepID=UPI00131A869A|nr:hypothetical protein [Acidisphaera sp. L21]